MIVPEGPNLGKMLRYVGRPLAVLLAYDIIVAVGYVYGGWRWIASPHIPLAIFGGAIGAILAFRNTSSYARWWEARILWGQIANSSRTLAREALSMIAAAQHDEAGRMEVLLLQRRIVFLQIAYVHALRCQLRGISVLNDIKRLLTEEDLEYVLTHQNQALAIQQRIASLVAFSFDRGWIDAMRWAAIDRTLSDMANAQGGAERIKNTPMPKQYDLFPQLFVRVYCLLLPLGMVSNLGMLTPIGSTLVGFIFLALDEIGRDLEAPFENCEHDVPLNAITRTIEINLKQMLGDSDIPAPVKPVMGVLW
ncbi:MAG TPA: bestrophin family ion channel [Bryobacteraceae bacterium]|jgi:putative membrane protein|nr:bestrophin family ion channel [Bryobacteraceae bacterium]